MQTGVAAMGNSMKVLQRLKTKLSYDAAVPLLGGIYYPKKVNHIQRKLKNGTMEWVTSTSSFFPAP